MKDISMKTINKVSFIVVALIIVLLFVFLKPIIENRNLSQNALKINNEILNAINIGDSLKAVFTIIDTKRLSHIIEYSGNTNENKEQPTPSTRITKTNNNSLQQYAENKYLKKYRYVVWKQSPLRQTFCIFEICENKVINKWMESNGVKVDY